MSHLTRVLGTKFRSSEGIASALKQWAISTALIIIYFTKNRNTDVPQILEFTKIQDIEGKIGCLPK